MNRGDIWLVALDPTLGSEIRKSRPCVIVSPPEMHDALPTVIVAPMTTKAHAAPFRVPVTHAGKRGLVLLDQIRAIDKLRLIRRAGTISASALDKTFATLREMFAH